MRAHVLYSAGEKHVSSLYRPIHYHQIIINYEAVNTNKGEYFIPCMNAIDIDYVSFVIQLYWNYWHLHSAMNYSPIV